MSYIYDILINWDKELYDFYEWNPTDEITHIRKIPVFKVSSDVLEIMTNYDFSLSSEFLSTIYSKTEIFTMKSVCNLEYAALFSDGEEVLAVLFHQSGRSDYKSKLLIDEAQEVEEVVVHLEETVLECGKIKEHDPLLKTREECKIEAYLKKELDRLKKDYLLDKLKYLYYECFGEKEEDKSRMLQRLRKSLKENWEEMYEKLYQFFKLSSQH